MLESVIWMGSQALHFIAQRRSIGLHGEKRREGGKEEREKQRNTGEEAIVVALFPSCG
jgi:hypothetical protein